MNSQVKTYIDVLYNLLKVVSFEEGTLESLGILNKFQMSANVLAPAIQINLFCPTLRVDEMVESHLNQRAYAFTIRIMIDPLKKGELLAQEALYYLEEQFVGILENNTSNAIWADGFLDTLSSITPEDYNFNPNYYVKEIRFAIKKRVTIQK